MKQKIGKILTILEFILYITMVVLVFVNSSIRYIDYSFFEKLFKGPFYELTYLLNSFLDFRISYFIVFIIGYISIWPIFSKCVFKLSKMAILWKKIMKIHNQKCETDEEQIEKVQLMLETYEKEGMSFFEILGLVLCSFLGTYFLTFIFNGAFNFEFFTINSYKILWFNLNEKDSLYILPATFVLVAFIIPFIKKLIKIKNNKLKFLEDKNLEEYEYEKCNLIFGTILTIACVVMLLSTVFNNVIFNIFILIPYIKSLIIINKKKGV